MSIKENLQENYINSIYVVNTTDGKGFHWLTISNRECDDNTWKVYDSMDMDFENYQFLFRKIFPDREKLNVIKVNIAKQSDGKNCGLYSLANALALARDLNPAHFTWINDNNEMRNHYRDCIANTKVKPFPFNARRAVRNAKKEIKLK
jgi:Ulp1 family protease